MNSSTTVAALRSPTATIGIRAPRPDRETSPAVAKKTTIARSTATTVSASGSMQMAPPTVLSTAVMTVVMALVTVAILAIVTGCGGKVPETRYYALSAPASTSSTGSVDLAVEPLSTEPGYDDERIVYRQNPYRLDYYQYHRWSAPPGNVIGGFLAQALDASGKFRTVTREASERTKIVLGGRVLAIEEIDSTTTQWKGHIIVELIATDHKTGEVVWSQKFDETQPLTKQSPEGLAEAMSTAMGRIVAKVAPQLGELGVAAK